AVGSWLYGVAYRTAMKARRSAGRRQQKEQHAPEALPETSPISNAAYRELQRLLDDEVQRLPYRYRMPFVLCCLEGLTKPEAARELGWKEGTVASRLVQSRKLLQTRLSRRGITLPAALTTVALSQQTASAAAPAVLMQSTVQAMLGPGA